MNRLPQLKTPRRVLTPKVLTPNPRHIHTSVRNTVPSVEEFRPTETSPTTSASRLNGPTPFHHEQFAHEEYYEENPFPHGMIVYQPVYVPLSAESYGYPNQEVSYSYPYGSWNMGFVNRGGQMGRRNNMMPTGTTYFNAPYQVNNVGYFPPRQVFNNPYFQPPATETSEDYEETNSVNSFSSDYQSLMPFIDLHQAIIGQLEAFGTCRVSWLNRLFCKASSEVEWNFCVETVEAFQKYGIEMTPETGTLLIKSACRLEFPEKALKIMQNLDFNISPTLSGIHYLMINFSQRQESKLVLEAFDVISLRNLSPNAKTYHILIRECADNGSFEQAIQFGEQCRQQKITPNRVTYNILMNGYRQQHKADQILTLRAEMDAQQMELNDTTAKFTALAYLMKRQPEKSLAAFLQAPSIKKEKELESFCNKLIETGKEDNYFRNLVLELFQKVQTKTPLPNSIRTQIEELKTLTFEN